MFERKEVAADERECTRLQAHAKHKHELTGLLQAGAGVQDVDASSWRATADVNVTARQP